MSRKHKAPTNVLSAGAYRCRKNALLVFPTNRGTGLWAGNADSLRTIGGLGCFSDAHVPGKTIEFYFPLSAENSARLF